MHKMQVSQQAGERGDEDRSGELKRHKVFRLQGNEGKSCKDTVGW